MIKRTYKPIMQKIEKLSNLTLICDMCKKEEIYTEEQIENGQEYMSDIQKQHFTFGYGSKYDNENCSFHLCDKCVENFINQLNITIK